MQPGCSSPAHKAATTPSKGLGGVSMPGRKALRPCSLQVQVLLQLGSIAAALRQLLLQDGYQLTGRMLLLLHVSTANSSTVGHVLQRAGEHLLCRGRCRSTVCLHQGRWPTHAVQASQQRLQLSSWGVILQGRLLLQLPSCGVFLSCLLFLLMLVPLQQLLLCGPLQIAARAALIPTRGPTAVVCAAHAVVGPAHAVATVAALCTPTTLLCAGVVVMVSTVVVAGRGLSSCCSNRSAAAVSLGPAASTAGLAIVLVGVSMAVVVAQGVEGTCAIPIGMTVAVAVATSIPCGVEWRK
jgi:hypothetical protein